MNRRDILKAFGIGIASATLSKVPSVEAKESEPFEPDVVLDYEHPLGMHVKVYLDGKEADQCFQAFVKWASFDRPTYGELVVGEGSCDSVFMREPKDDEVECQGHWAKKRSGLVYMKIEPDKKWVLEQIRGNR
jgi:hypothetical protein